MKAEVITAVVLLVCFTLSLLATLGSVLALRQYLGKPAGIIRYEVIEAPLTNAAAVYFDGVETTGENL